MSLLLRFKDGGPKMLTEIAVLLKIRAITADGKLAVQPLQGYVVEL
jgi:hypothetical protein